MIRIWEVWNLNVGPELFINVLSVALTKHCRKVRLLRNDDWEGDSVWAICLKGPSRTTQRHILTNRCPNRDSNLSRP
jgi:hypothetical protein